MFDWLRLFFSASFFKASIASEESVKEVLFFAIIRYKSGMFAVSKIREMIRTYKRKLVLNKRQEARILSWLGCCRLVYNMGLEISNATYKATGKGAHKFALGLQLKDIRNEYRWMKDVPVECLEQALNRLHFSYQKFFQTFKTGGGFPKFASKRKWKTLEFRTVSVSEGKIKLPKIGFLKIFSDEEIIGDPRTAKITVESTGFFITIQCKDVPARFVSDNQTIGLDMGITHFCIDSNGKYIANPRHFKKYERKLRIKNRSLSRKKKGSNGWRKQAKKLGLLHHTISNVRRDFLHKESTRIAKANNVVYMEDLRITSMAKNRNLSKHILDAGWGTFRAMLHYKTKVVLVDPKYTSQTCNECGCVDSVNRVSQSEFKCRECGHSANADHNAALNILSRGTVLSRKRETIV